MWRHWAYYKVQIRKISTVPPQSLLRLLWFVAFAAYFAIPSVESQTALKPELHYFVIDRSGSIKNNHLVAPIRGAFKQRVSQIPENSEIRVVLFNTTADKPKIWTSIDAAAREEIETWFLHAFDARRDTRLFDTVAEALKEIAEDKLDFSLVYLTILSDGIEDPPVSVDFRSWKDIEPLGRELKRSDPPFFGTWYTLGFTPPEVPDPTSGISTQNVPDPTRVDLTPPKLEADFEWAPRSAYAGDPIRLIDVSIGIPKERIWRIKNGAEYTDTSPEVVFETPGKYEVSLTVFRDSDSSIRSKEIVVGEYLVKADFSVSDQSGRAPLSVEFRDKSKGEIVRYLWDFGDGSTSNLKSPTHEYSTPGQFRPILTVTNTSGEQTTSDGELQIKVKPPAPWWIKPLIVIVAFILAWFFIVVPLVLNPILLPHKSATLQADVKHRLRQLVNKHKTRFIWPRSFVTLGDLRKADIRVGAARRSGRIHARVRRLPGSKTYVLSSNSPNSVSILKTERDAMGNQVVTKKPLAKPVSLRDADRFELLGREFTWNQPASSRTKKTKKSK